MTLIKITGLKEIQTCLGKWAKKKKEKGIGINLWMVLGILKKLLKDGKIRE